MNKGKITQKVFVPEAPGLEKTIDETRQGSAFEDLRQAGPKARNAYIETYGCQMNFSDTEIIASVLTDMGYGFTQDELTADLVLLNTCAIRENAEEKVWNRLKALKRVKKTRPNTVVGVMGCMAERLKAQLMDREQLVDLVVGPDAYRDIPRLVEEAETGQKSVNVLLSREETYADISPIRLNSNGVTSFISIMRGCDNMCSFCVVPFTRGRERSRDPESIVNEAKELVAQGYKEVTLLGQNVDSYHYEDTNFAQLLEKVALISPDLRVRFSTSHPKDIVDDVLHTMAKYENICNYIHLPVQSGSSRILEVMRRGYSREWYMNKVNRIREIIPDCSISTDIITGFCSETEEDHQETLSMVEWARYSMAFMFFYSERPGTLAARKYPDDVDLEIKKQRLAEVIELQNRIQREISFACIGKTCKVLIEGNSKRSQDDWCGRNDHNQMVIFPKNGSDLKPGDYVMVKITEATSITLKGEVMA
ncbi:MAG: tRNA (N6-isopentenyl adenosine(37)-C2)-methylthiotransferase MiaB [Bacteroidia bacterium]|nr:tRNA (N6-isopentenyl adenosine(37)-C2)-methylthiotransferase MiaB [Bacteroidia bacterium]